MKFDIFFLFHEQVSLDLAKFILFNRSTLHLSFPIGEFFSIEHYSCEFYPRKTLELWLNFSKNKNALEIIILVVRYHGIFQFLDAKHLYNRHNPFTPLSSVVLNALPLRCMSLLGWSPSSCSITFRGHQISVTTFGQVVMDIWWLWLRDVPNIFFHMYIHIWVSTITRFSSRSVNRHSRLNDY